jgi:hypothetical protein
VHPSAKRCVQWAAAAAVGGAVLLVYGAQIFTALAERAGANAEVGLHLVNLVLTVVNALLFPLAAALVGAAVVIQVVAPRGDLPPTAEPADVGGDARNPNTQ